MRGGIVKLVLTSICLQNCIICPNAINIDILNNNIEIQLFEWSNFTIILGIEEDEVLNGTVVVEIMPNDFVNIYPKIVEINIGNITKWRHIFFVNAVATGRTVVDFVLHNTENVTYREDDTKIDVDIVRTRLLKTAIWWCTFLSYIFSYFSNYPQIILNFVRQSVIGLSSDYTYLNFITNLCVCVYVSFIPSILPKVEYLPNNTQQFMVTVAMKFHSLHGLLLSIILTIQLLKYPSENRRMSVVVKETITILAILVIFGLLLVHLNAIHYVTFLFIWRVASITTNVTQCLPQIYTNYYTKSTVGWCIWTSHFVILSRIFFIAHACLYSYNYNDWSAVIFNEKVWMALQIMLQHSILIIQQCWIYEPAIEVDAESELLTDEEPSVLRNIMAFEQIKEG